MSISTRQLTATAMISALTAVSSFLTIPIGPVPATMQSCVVLAAGPLLGARLGAISQLVYLMMGFAGLPVFAGGKAGLGIVLTPSFGFLVGFIATAYVTGRLGTTRTHRSAFRLVGSMSTGLLLLFACGATYLYLLFNYILDQEITLTGVWMIGIMPFIFTEVIKLAVAVIVVMALARNGIPDRIMR